uniref:Endonuclease/exonuclease/phosphatase domain-containing protein n=1 Tax=Aegilops tauschii subsp. strangulata TaxID=200361 RepID=A0A453FS01_AEGTS
MRDERIDIVAIQETMRTEFTLSELEWLSTHLFAWHWLPSSGIAGHSGGILLGVKDVTFEALLASIQALDLQADSVDLSPDE